MTPIGRRQLRRAIKKGRTVRVQNADDLAAIAGELRGLAVHITIEHDHGCTPSACRCSPSFVLQKLTPAAYAAGARAERDWLQAVCS